MSSGLFASRLTLRRCILFVVTTALLAGLTQPAVATTAATADTTRGSAAQEHSHQFLQQTGNETDASGNDSAGNGTETDDSGGGGIVGTIFGVIGGVFGGIISFFADNIIGQAIIGLSLGIYIGLKGLAIYIERYE